MRLFYRARQTWGVLMHVPTQQDLGAVKEFLTPFQMSLFLRMHPSEQAHSIYIFNRLRQQGQNQHDLLAAALLHDAGKSRYPPSLFERILVVLCHSLFPGKAQSWGQGPPIGWKKPFVVSLNHAKWGAEMAAEAGASALTVEIIKRHQDRINLYEFHDSAWENKPDCLIPSNEHLIYNLQRLDNES